MFVMELAVASIFCYYVTQQTILAFVVLFVAILDISS